MIFESISLPLSHFPSSEKQTALQITRLRTQGSFFPLLPARGLSSQEKQDNSISHFAPSYLFLRLSPWQPWSRDGDYILLPSHDSWNRGSIMGIVCLECWSLDQNFTWLEEWCFYTKKDKPRGPQAVPLTPTKCSALRIGVSLKEKFIIVPTNISRALTQRFLPGGEKQVKI